MLPLRREALVSDPFAFSSSPDTDVGLDPEFLRKAMRNTAAQAMFGAFEEDTLVGMAGVYRQDKEKEAHKAGLWGMYVRPAHRGQGLGRGLLSAALEFARSLPGVTHLHLSVSETAPAALRLYESMGFVTWGTEPAALRVGERSVSIRHMVLALGDTVAS